MLGGVRDEAQLQEPKAGLLTLSESPWPKWAALPNLDLIRLRNRPVTAPTATAAPFFLVRVLCHIYVPLPLSHPPG